MIEKTGGRLCQVLDSVILAGVIILFIGLYYWMIKAGIPNQDPPLELQIKYAVNMGIGEILLGNGFKILVFGGIARLLFGIIWKKHKKNS